MLLFQGQRSKLPTSLPHPQVTSSLLFTAYSKPDWVKIDLSSQVEANIPVILHLLHTAFSGQQAAQLHAWEGGAWVVLNVITTFGKAQV